MRLLSSPEAGIAIGISLLFIVAGLIMHRVFVRILKNDTQESPNND